MRRPIGSGSTDALTDPRGAWRLLPRAARAGPASTRLPSLLGPALVVGLKRSEPPLSTRDDMVVVV